MLSALHWGKRLLPIVHLEAEARWGTDYVSRGEERGANSSINSKRESALLSRYLCCVSHEWMASK